MPYTYEACGLSDIGLVRENNEDVWAEIEEINFFVLADGMGGHQAGEVASREAVSHLLRLVRKAFKTTKKKSVNEAAKAIKHAIVQVNTIVYRISKSKKELGGMGSTLCCLLLHEEGAVFAHVGDSRIYRFRGGHIEQMTRDHSLFRELVDLGQLSEAYAPDFAYKNIITRAIGTEPKVEVSVDICDIEPDDIFLLCSDGLSDLLTPAEMQTILKEDKSVDQWVQALISAANARGGVDNVTSVLIHIHEKDHLSRQ